MKFDLLLKESIILAKKLKYLIILHKIPTSRNKRKTCKPNQIHKINPPEFTKIKENKEKIKNERRKRKKK